MNVLLYVVIIYLCKHIYILNGCLGGAEIRSLKLSSFLILPHIATFSLPIFMSIPLPTDLPPEQSLLLYYKHLFFLSTTHVSIPCIYPSFFPYSKCSCLMMMMIFIHQTGFCMTRLCFRSRNAALLGFTFYYQQINKQNFSIVSVIKSKTC